MVKEIWKWVKGYREYYKVSTHGRVKSVSRFTYHRSGTPRLVQGKILKPNLNKKTGYFYVFLSKKGKVQRFHIHELVLVTFKGPRPAIGMECRHLDDIKSNNYDWNLVWGTRKQNMEDAVRNGRWKNPFSY